MASWSDAKINMMDEKADKEVDEMLFQFAFLLIQVSTILLLIVNSSKEGFCLQLAAFCLLPSTNLVPSV